MVQVHPLPTTPTRDAASKAKPGAPVKFIETASCGLCGAKLSSRALRYQMVSPLSTRAPITVCHTCHRAALGEGYRPAE